MHNAERVARIQASLKENRLDAFVCTLPQNVLMVTGYWPVVGASAAVACSDGNLILIVPEDEKELAGQSWAADVQTFRPGSLNKLTSARQEIRPSLRSALSGPKKIGCESGSASEPASYVAMHLYGGELRELIVSVCPGAEVIIADDALSRLRAIKTPIEIDRIRSACGIAATAFDHGAGVICPGVQEAEAAAQFMSPLEPRGLQRAGVERSGGLVSCMSGKRSGTAYGAYARSTAKQIETGDLVLTHCNSQANGYWTDITRTFVIGDATERQREMYAAVLQARLAALGLLRAGVPAKDVDSAARAVLKERGYGDRFKHSTGHGVGFGAIDAGALPRLHPMSPDVLETGMVFNIEPGIYFEDYGGMRHCDMVAITDQGAEVLTPFFCSIEELSR